MKKCFHFGDQTDHFGLPLSCRV